MRSSGTAKPTKILLVDDHEMVRQGLRALLEAEPDFEVIGEAADGLQAIEVARRLRPDVMVVDVMLPGLNGLEVAGQLRKLGERVRVVMLSMFSDESYVLRALQNGASAYVLKCAAFEDLVRAIRHALAGRTFLSPTIIGKEAEPSSIAENAVENAIAPDAYETLTDREKQVLQLAAEGHTNPEIAQRLGISPRTVESHRSHLAAKLGLRNHTALVLFALRRGLISIET